MRASPDLPPLEGGHPEVGFRGRWRIKECRREPDVPHHRQADDLGAHPEPLERAGLGHGESYRPLQLTPFPEPGGVLSAVTLAFSGSAFGTGETENSGTATFFLLDGSFGQSVSASVVNVPLTIAFGDLLSAENSFGRAYSPSDFIGAPIPILVTLGFSDGDALRTCRATPSSQRVGRSSKQEWPRGQQGREQWRC
jgi:hypothetical protein